MAHEALCIELIEKANDWSARARPRQERQQLNQATRAQLERQLGADGVERWLATEASDP